MDRQIYFTVTTKLVYLLASSLLSGGCIGYISGSTVTFHLDTKVRVDNGLAFAGVRSFSLIRGAFPFLSTPAEKKDVHFDDKNLVVTLAGRGHPQLTLRAKQNLPLRIFWRDSVIASNGNRYQILPACKVGSIEFEGIREWRLRPGSEVPIETVINGGEEAVCELHIQQEASFDDAAQVCYSPPIVDRMPPRESLSGTELQRIASAEVGREIVVSIPIEINANRHLYVFGTTISRIDVKPWKRWCFLNC